MGWVWDLKVDMEARLGSAAGYDRTQKIVIPTIVADAGSMAAQIREVFLLDDDDGNLNNGTPNYASLEKASVKRTVPFPKRVNPNAGTYVTYGTGCPGSGLKAGVGCLNVNDTGTRSTFGTRANLIYAIRATAPTALTVDGFEIDTSGSQTVTTYLYSATASGQPNQILATGSMVVGSAKNWYRTTFPTPVNIAQGQQFFIAFRNNASTISASIRSGTQTPYFRNDGPSGSWNGPLSGFSWAFRVNCVGGPGATPALSFTGLPEISTNFAVNLSKANPNSTGLFLVGVSDTLWNGLTLPFDLSTVGATGCRLLAGGDVQIGMTTSANGTASMNFLVPNNTTLVGSRFFNQFAITDNANSFGVVFSDAGAGKVGRQ